MRSTERPTELAEHLFGLAWGQARDVENVEQVGRVLGNITLGLVNMAVGLRATYMKLEKLEHEIAELKRRGERAEILSMLE